MTQATILSRIAVGTCAALITGTVAFAQTPPPAAAPPASAPPASAPPASAPPAAPAPAAPAAPQFAPTATITTPGYPGVGPADSKLRVVNLPGGKRMHLLPATLETTPWGWFDTSQTAVPRGNL